MILEFLSSLPLALERRDLRVVHACWCDRMIDLSRAAVDVMTLYHEHLRRILAELDDNAADDIDRDLAQQNKNPVKLLTSGPEERISERFWAGGKWRHGKRVSWWEKYSGDQFCVFGHYSAPRGSPHEWGKAICVDYGASDPENHQSHRLAASEYRKIEFKIQSLCWNGQAATRLSCPRRFGRKSKMDSVH